MTTDLILWRHAEAEDNSVSGLDTDRELTRQGRKDAAKMASWLKRHLPANTIVLVSPARRCQETAAALAEISKVEIRTVDFLSINHSAAMIVKEIALMADAKTLLIVGHQPNLGYLIAGWLKMQNSSCVVKKGAVWWLRQRQRQLEATEQTALQTYLLTVQHPDYL